MKLLFVYGTKVKKDQNNNYYTNGTLPSNIWKERYGVISNNITFIGNIIGNCTKNEIKKLNKIDESVKFIGIKDNINNFKNLLSLNTKKHIKNIIKKEVQKSDIVIVRVPDVYSYYAIDYAKKYNKKIITEVVGCIWDSLWNHSIKGKLIAFPFFIIMKKYVKKSPNVIYVSNEFLQKRYPTNGKSISCSDVILNHDEKNKKINKIFNRNKVILGTCAALDVPYKGQKYVIKALSILKKIGYNNFEYQLVGGGNSDKIKEYIKKYNVERNVKIIGEITHDKVFEWLDNVDIYIQPSNQEGMCRSIIEAMSRGCPCIVSDAGGNPELIDNNYVFKRKNVKQLCDKIIKMNHKEMINQSKINFLKSFDFNKNKLDIRRKKFYKDVLENHNNIII